METKKMTLAIGHGLAAIFIIAIITSLLFSLLLRFTDVQEQSITYIVMAISFISLFIGGFISGGKGKKQGMLLGGGTGLLYFLIIFLFQYLGNDSIFSMRQFIYYACFILTAMMGGVLGVNVSSSRNS